MVVGDFDKLLDELLLDGLELRPVGGGEQHLEAVRCKDPSRRNGPAQVHLPRQAPADLDRLQPASEHPRESSLDETLEATLEAL